MKTDLTNIKNELLLKFFLTFSRFEFALKNAGFYKKCESTQYDAKPDWETFASSVKEQFQKQNDKQNDNDSFKVACYNICDKPPRKQIIINETLEWQNNSTQKPNSDINQILIYVRRVRNNLFHGGKCEIASDKKRDKELLQDSLIILNGCLKLSKDVKVKYDMATLL